MSEVQQTAVGVHARQTGRIQNPWAAWGLTLVTLGVYHIFWWYRINKELRDFDSRIGGDPTKSMLALLIGWVIIIPPFVTFFGTAGRIRHAQSIAGQPVECSGFACLVLAWLGFSVPYMQGKLNRLYREGAGA